MKNFVMIVLAVIIGVSLSTASFAQTVADQATKAATDIAKDKVQATGDAAKDKATKAVTEKAAPALEKKAPSKVKVQKYTGEVTAIDMATKTLTVKGKKGDMTFDITDVKIKSEPKQGDKVYVKYTELDGKMVAKSVIGKKDTKKKTKKKAKPAAAENTTAPTPEPSK